MSKYPEHEKLKANDREHAAVQRFLEYLSEEGFVLGAWGDYNLVPANTPHAALVASFFGIDRDALEREKRAMIETLNASHVEPRVDALERAVWTPPPAGAIVGVDLAADGEHSKAIPGVYAELPTVEPRPLVDPRFIARFLGYADQADTDAALAGMLRALDTEVTFESRIEARSECFMADGPRRYTYGTDRNARTYYATPFHPVVRTIMDVLNRRWAANYNVCVLNRYRDERQALGWHSDDSPEQDQAHPIAVVSFGATREIWVRRIGTKGDVPPMNRFVLTPGSLFVMPGGYQQTHQHRIPKPFGACGLRISLTYRKLDR